MRWRVAVPGFVALVLAVCAGCTSSPVGSTTNVVSRSTGSSAAISGPAAPAAVASATRLPAPTVGSFRDRDVSYLGSNVWALGTRACGGGRCAALLHSANDGRTWRSVHLPPVRVRAPYNDTKVCTTPCVDTVRFATSKIGYLAGGADLDQHANEALFMTRDGGRSWQRGKGGADALEPGDGNVIRLVARDHCSLACTYDVETAKTGSTRWRTHRLTGPYGDPRTAVLVRSGNDAYVKSYGNPAGGGDARSVLWTSTNDGSSWTNRGEPCPQSPSRGATTGEVDGSEISAAPDRSVTILCQPRGANNGAFLITSTDGGARFTRQGDRPADFSYELAAVTTGTILNIAGPENGTRAGHEYIDRSTDRGRHWTRIASAGKGTFMTLAASTTRTIHVVGHGGQELLTSNNAGRTWTRESIKI